MHPLQLARCSRCVSCCQARMRRRFQGRRTILLPSQGGRGSLAFVTGKEGAHFVSRPHDQHCCMAVHPVYVGRRRVCARAIPSNGARAPQKKPGAMRKGASGCKLTPTFASLRAVHRWELSRPTETRSTSPFTSAASSPACSQHLAPLTRSRDVCPRAHSAAFFSFPASVFSSQHTVGRFYEPGGICSSANGDGMYVSDRENHSIRFVTEDGVVSTVCGGSSKESGWRDGPGKGPAALETRERFQTL
eukprot:2435217-Rhodomonas_salina.1